MNLRERSGGPRGTGRQGRARCHGRFPGGRRLRGGSTRSAGSGPGRGRRRRFLYLRDLGQVRNRLPLLHEDLAQDALERRWNFGVHLVGDDLEERLVLGHAVTGLLEPLADRSLGHALAQLGHGHLGHVTLLR